MRLRRHWCQMTAEALSNTTASACTITRFEFAHRAALWNRRCCVFPKKWRQGVTADLARLVEQHPVKSHLWWCLVPVNMQQKMVFICSASAEPVAPGFTHTPTTHLQPPLIVSILSGSEHFLLIYMFFSWFTMKPTWKRDAHRFKRRSKLESS